MAKGCSSGNTTSTKKTSVSARARTTECASERARSFARSLNEQRAAAAATEATTTLRIARQMHQTTSSSAAAVAIRCCCSNSSSGNLGSRMPAEVAAANGAERRRPQLWPLQPALQAASDCMQPPRVQSAAQKVSKSHAGLCGPSRESEGSPEKGDGTGLDTGANGGGLPVSMFAEHRSRLFVPRRHRSRLMLTFLLELHLSTS